MLAIKHNKYGSPEVLQVVNVDRPVPAEKELLIKVNSASATRADTMMRKGKPFLGRLMLGLTSPKYQGIGTGFAGEIVDVGKDVVEFKVGDAVFGESIFGQGSNAEYITVHEHGVISKLPDGLSYLEACSVTDGAVTSLNFLRDVAKIQQQHHVLINGASGSLGTAAIQIAKYYGAEVTAVCSSKNKQLVSSLGADHVIAYDKQDIRKIAGCFDIVFDTIGGQSLCYFKDLLKPRGIYLTPVFSIKNLLAMFITKIMGRKKSIFSATGMRPENELRELVNDVKDMIEEKRLQLVIDRTFSLKEIVNAHAYIETGHKKGNIVITM